MGGLVRYGDGVGLPESNRVVLPSTVDIYDEAGQLVGYATSHDRKDNRTVERIRHLSSADAGRTVEQAPGPENVVVTLTGFALYNKTDTTGKIPHYSLAARISRGTGTLGGYGGVYLFKSINSQKIPFTMRIQSVHPVTGSKTVEYYRNCMLTDWGRTTNTTATTVTETATVQVGQVDDIASASSGDAGVVVGA